MCIVIHCKNPLYKKKEITLEELSLCQCVTFNKVFAERTFHILKKYGHYKRVISINDMDSIRKVCSSAEYFTFVPSKLFHEKFSNFGDFKMISVNNFKWECQIGVIRKENLSKVEETYLHYLKLATSFY